MDFTFLLPLFLCFLPACLSVESKAYIHQENSFKNQSKWLLPTHPREELKKKIKERNFCLSVPQAG